MNTATFALAAVVGTLALAGCAADTTNYPSLARRPAERTDAAPPPSPAPAPAPLAAPPGQSAQLTGLVEKAREAHRRFAAQQGRAEQTVAAGSGAAQGSESWALASVALAQLESARSEAMVSLADLDHLYAATRIEGGDTAGIAAARDSVSEVIREEDRVLASLRGKLSGQ